MSAQGVERMTSLWIEGYAATGDGGPAQYLGEYEGEYFEAVAKWAIEKNSRQEWGTLRYDTDTKVWSAWGCRIFDNESEARSAFG